MAELHILNGDSTLWAMEKTEIPGIKVVWRDVLSDGPVIAYFASPEFWKLRTKYMVEAFGASPQEFEEKCITEFGKIETTNDLDEIVLWFEYDLFCQINMLGVLHYLSLNANPKLKISLVCVGHETGSDRLLALGEISPDHYPNLFEERTALEVVDLAYASQVYMAYCSADPRDIHRAIKGHPKFPYLNGAFDAHLRRFPFRGSGLNEIEQALSNIIQAGAQSDRETVGKVLQWQQGTYYGFGDSQYFNYLERLRPLIDKDFKWMNHSPIGLIDRNYMLGGAIVSDWLWDEDQEELVPS